VQAIICSPKEGTGFDRRKKKTCSDLSKKPGNQPGFLVSEIRYTCINTFLLYAHSKIQPLEAPVAH